MTDYKKILTSDNDEIKKNYYYYFLLNNFCLIDDFHSFQESLFDTSSLNDNEKQQLFFILSYLLEAEHPLFQVTPIYLNRLKKYFLCLLKNKEYRIYRKIILKNLSRLEQYKKFYKENPDIVSFIWKNYKDTYGFDKNIEPTTSLIQKLVSTDLLMYDYLFINHLEKIVEENFLKEKGFYAASLFHIFYTAPIDFKNKLSQLEEKMRIFLNKYMENETNEQILLFGRKLNILFEKYLLSYNKNNISFFPEQRSKLVYQSEPLNGKILKFQREDT